MPDEVIGRAADQAVVRDFVSRARTAPSALVIEGEAGIGKTTLWNAAVRSAAREGSMVLAARPANAEAAMALGAFADLFGDVPDDVFRSLPGPQRHALEVALLRRSDEDDAPLDQRAISFATTNLLRTLADRAGPVLVAIDDVQWLDATSAAVIAFAARRLADRPIGILVSKRTTGVEPAPLELDTAVAPERFERITVGPLSLGELHQLTVAKLGRPFRRLTLIQIERASAGNPFYALEIGRALLRSGDPVTPGERLPVSPTLEGLIGQRVGALPDGTRDVLVLAAAAIEPTLDVVERAGSVDAADLLEPAVAEAIVTIEAGSVRFTHPLLASAALAGVGPAAMREIHLRLADAVRSEDVRARHLGLATEGRDEGVAAALDGAAAATRVRGATLDATAMYERASELTPDDHPERAIRRAILAAEGAFIDLSDFHYADQILERALARARPGPARAEARSLRAIVWYFHGRQAEATTLCEEALPETAGDRIVRAKVLLRLAYLHAQVDMERALAEMLEGAEILERDPVGVDPDLLAVAFLDRANGLLQMATALRRRDIARGTRLHTGAGRSWEWSRSEAVMYELARHTDDLERARSLLTEQIERRADRGGDDPFAFVHLAMVTALLGRLGEARPWAERALEGYAREGPDLYPAFALRGLAYVAALQGQVDEARDLATRGLDLGTASGDLVVTMLHRQVLALVALSTDDPAEADRHLTAAAALAEQVGARHPLRFRLEGDEVEAALAVGDVERARVAVERLERAGALAPTPWTLAIGARCRGLVEAALGDLDAAAAALERAMVEHDALPMPFERGRTLLVKGQVHRRRREKGLADRTLREAVAIFEELGAPLWVEKARRELARVGLRPRAPSELTSTERRVAELAATGLSSREIAEVAFMAPKTVGNVLGRVYRKLGIDSRAELGARMSLLAERQAAGGLGAGPSEERRDR